MSGRIEVTIRKIPSGNPPGGVWTWDASDSSGVVAALPTYYAQKRAVVRDLSRLLGCELEPVKQGGRIVAYLPIGRSNDVKVTVER